ncbi:MAG TPA: DHA2 family efflux MFS transporter permease subunit [Candidatus Limnocylindrales bacterium]|nr:DHA2 family efflux MFS transporter permease subunit [Candidatus Limnocylindrales bacterium]
MTRRSSAVWTFAITALALFMVSLDNLVVTMALPVIRRDLGASLSDLEWTVNAYTLTFASLLLLGAALGDRFGRRRVFALGLVIFTLGSAAAALSTSSTSLILARAAQGLGGAFITPLSLTILSEAISPARRPLALGAWGGISGLAIAIGPVVGGAITQGINWHWIFWLNVPLGIAAVALSAVRLRESFGPGRSLDLPGVALAGAGLVGIVWGVTHGNARGWTDPQILLSIGLGAVLMVAFVAWEARAREPILPLGLFRRRASLVANGISFLMSFGMFGSIFLLSQFFQIVQGLDPFQAGLRVLPWTAMPIFVAPIAGLASSRVNPRWILVTGLALMAGGLAWIAVINGVTTPYASLVPAFMVSGAGMGLFFAPIANVVLSAVPREDEGKASGANNTIRELGGVFGVAVLAAIFAGRGSYASPQLYVDGLVPAVFAGAGVVAIASVVAIALPRLSAVRSGMERADGAVIVTGVASKGPELVA